MKISNRTSNLITFLLLVWVVGGLSACVYEMKRKDEKWHEYTNTHHCTIVETTTSIHGTHGEAWVCPKE